MASSENDLPLLSNTTDILVRHFLLDLTCHMDARMLQGSVTLFLDPASVHGQSQRVFSIQEYHLKGQESDSTSRGDTLLGIRDNSTSTIRCEDDKPDLDKLHDGAFTLVLDCCDLDVHSVECVPVSDVIIRTLTSGLTVDTQDLYSDVRQLKGTRMNYTTEKWCVKVSAENAGHPWEFPRVIRIHYSTKPDGDSLRWAVDQDNRYMYMYLYCRYLIEMMVFRNCSAFAIFIK